MTRDGLNYRVSPKGEAQICPYCRDDFKPGDSVVDGHFYQKAAGFVKHRDIKFDTLMHKACVDAHHLQREGKEEQVPLRERLGRFFKPYVEAVRKYFPQPDRRQRRVATAAGVGLMTLVLGYSALKPGVEVVGGDQHNYLSQVSQEDQTNNTIDKQVKKVRYHVQTITVPIEDNTMIKLDSTRDLDDLEDEIVTIMGTPFSIPAQTATDTPDWDKIYEQLPKAIEKGAVKLTVGGPCTNSASATPNQNPENYPPRFIQDGQFETAIVVGDPAPAEDVIGHLDVAAFNEEATSVIEPKFTDSKPEFSDQE